MELQVRKDQQDIFLVEQVLMEIVLKELVVVEVEVMVEVHQVILPLLRQVQQIPVVVEDQVVL